MLQPLQKRGSFRLHCRGCAGKRVGHVSNDKSVAWQATLTERALELLALPDDGMPRLLLDLGCGSGLSGEELTNRGHMWVVRPPRKAGGASLGLNRLSRCLLTGVLRKV